MDDNPCENCLCNICLRRSTCQPCKDNVNCIPLSHCKNFIHSVVPRHEDCKTCICNYCIFRPLCAGCEECEKSEKRSLPVFHITKCYKVRE